MPPTPQAVQLTGQKQSQQQYDPSKGPPVQNAASLHTPPPQLPGRVQPPTLPITSLPAALQLTQQQQITDAAAQPSIHVKSQLQSVTSTAVSHGQVQVPLQPQGQPAAHVQGQSTAQASQPQAPAQQQQVFRSVTCGGWVSGCMWHFYLEGLWVRLKKYPNRCLWLPIAFFSI